MQKGCNFFGNSYSFTLAVLSLTAEVDSFCVELCGIVLKDCNYDKMRW